MRPQTRAVLTRWRSEARSGGYAPAELANVVAFSASDKASSLHVAELYVDGGIKV